MSVKMDRDDAQSRHAALRKTHEYEAGDLEAFRPSIQCVGPTLAIETTLTDVGLGQFAKLWITVVLDVKSRLILASAYGEEPPDAEVIVCVVQEAVRSAASEFARFVTTNVQDTHEELTPVAFRPLIVFDSHAYANHEAMRLMPRINFAFRSPSSPSGRGSVERALYKMKSDLDRAVLAASEEQNAPSTAAVRRAIKRKR
jgi:hypothetical protein